MVLPVLDWCDAVWHECGQGNSDKIERLRRSAVRIVYFKAASKLSTDQIMTKLGLEPLYYKRWTHILRGSLPKTGPMLFGSENRLPLNFAHEYILVQK